MASGAAGGEIKLCTRNRAAWPLGRRVAAEPNGLVADDGPRPCWATIRRGLGAGLQQPIDLDANRDR